MKYYIVLLMSLLFLTACNNKDQNNSKNASKKVHKPEAVGPDKSIENYSIVGNWQMEKVVEDGSNVTKEHNPNGDRWIQFFPNQKFWSGGTSGKNTGKWYWNPQEKMLFIDSDAGKDDDSYWIVEFSGKKMTWKGTKTEFAERFVMEFSKGVWLDGKEAPSENPEKRLEQIKK
ncbi:MAG: lipocalin family protein [Bacteroidota bacterium]